MIAGVGRRTSSMRHFVQGMIAGGVLGALSVYLLSPDSDMLVSPERAGERVEDIARRVKRKSSQMMDR